MAIKSVVALLAVLAAVSTASAAEVHANGAARIIVQDRPVGPYLLRVGIVPGTPAVGLLHLSILVREAAGESPVTGAAVSVLAVGPEGSAGPLRMDAVSSLESPQLYEGNLSLDAAGPWTLTIETDGPLGKAILEAPIEVQESGPVSLLFVILGALLVVIVGVLLWSQLQRNRRRRSPGTAR